MNTSALTNSSKKKRRSSSVSSRRFHLANKQAKLIISRKCRRLNLLDRNRHLNDISLNNPNDISNSEEMDVNSIKTEKQVPNILPFQLNQQKQLTANQPMVVEQQRTNGSETIKTMAPTSRINELKTKFANFKNNLVKSITNMKKPPNHSNSNVKQEKSHMPQATTSNLRHSSTTSVSKLPAVVNSSRKPTIMPLNENLNPKTINEQHKRLQSNVLIRSSSVSAFKHESKPLVCNNSLTMNAVSKLNTMKQMRKFDSSSACTLSISTNSLLHKSKENVNGKPVFNQYAKISYNDSHLYQHTSVNLK